MKKAREHLTYTRSVIKLVLEELYKRRIFDIAEILSFLEGSIYWSQIDTEEAKEELKKHKQRVEKKLQKIQETPNVRP